MDLEKTIHNLRKNEFEVSYFETAAEAAAYLDSRIDGKTVGFGDSETLRTFYRQNGCAGRFDSSKVAKWIVK